MQIIDAQVHAYERDSPDRPWKGHLSGPPEVTGEQMIAAMDQAGIDAAVLTSPFSLYGYDPSYALSVAAQWPDRFAVVAPVDVTRPDADEYLEAWSANPLTVGLRVMALTGEAIAKLLSAPDSFFRALARNGQPLCLGCWGHIDEVGPLMRRHADVQFIIDHVGLYQPLEPPAPAEPFADLPKVLALAACENIAIKVTGVATLSHAPFPYADIWPALARVFDAFGIDRCMWGTDWTRATGYLTLDQAVQAMEVTPGLDAAELEALAGGTLRKILRWSPSYVGQP